MLTKPDGTEAAEIPEQRARAAGMYFAHICNTLTATSFVDISFAFINAVELERGGGVPVIKTYPRCGFCKLPGIPRFCLASS